MFNQPNSKPGLQNKMDRRMFMASAIVTTTLGVASKASAQERSLEFLLLNDPDTPVSGNLAGDITLVSFFDYNCPYCKRSIAPLEAVLERDGNIRHVYKDWPILGEASRFGARRVLAARYQDKYSEAHHALMDIEGQGVTEDQMTEALKAVLDFDQLENDFHENDAEILEILQRNDRLANWVGLGGVPAFIAGNYLNPGVIDEAKLTDMISAAREES